MGFHRQFEIFHPLEGTLPELASSLGFSIVSRARWALRRRTAEQVWSIAQDAEFLICQVFKSDKSDAVEASDTLKRLDVLEDDIALVDATIGRLNELRDSHRERGDISDFQALREGLAKFRDGGSLEIDDVGEDEYFAALALWRVGDYVGAFSRNKATKAAVKTDVVFSVRDLGVISGHLLEAMEAVCHAYRLSELQLAEEKNKTLLIPVRLFSAEQQAQWAQGVRDEHDAVSRERYRANGAMAHVEDNERRDEVQRLWLKNPTQYRSASKAGIGYADYLQEKYGETFEPETVAKWIRKCAKDNDIKLRISSGRKP